MRIKLALGAIPLLCWMLAPTSALAADLGGNCCADLEERVAELEAISAHKGNRKMSVTIYGQVDYAYFGFTGNSLKNQSGVVNNSLEPTMVGITGEAQISKLMKAGFRVEFQMDDRLNLSQANGLSFPNEVVMRQAIAWVDTALGKISIGHGSMASDYTSSITTANTAVASRMLSLAPVSTIFLVGYDLPFNDVRRDVVRYDSPELMGFRISGSVANGDTPVGGPGFATHDAYDVALRYASELGPFRLAAAIAYRNEQQSLATLVVGDFRSTVIDGSGSIMHMPTGLFVNVAGGRVTNDGIWGNFDAYQFQAGVEKAFFKDIGATTLFGEWGELNTQACAKCATRTPSIYGLGAVQNFSQLATDVYVDWKHYDTTPLGTAQGFDQFMGGLRVKF